MDEIRVVKKALSRNRKRKSIINITSKMDNKEDELNSQKRFIHPTIDTVDFENDESNSQKGLILSTDDNDHPASQKHVPMSTIAETSEDLFSYDSNGGSSKEEIGSSIMQNSAGSSNSSGGISTSTSTIDEWVEDCTREKLVWCICYHDEQLKWAIVIETYHGLGSGSSSVEIEGSRYSINLADMWFTLAAARQIYPEAMFYRNPDFEPEELASVYYR